MTALEVAKQAIWDALEFLSQKEVRAVMESDNMLVRAQLQVALKRIEEDEQHGH